MNDALVSIQNLSKRFSPKEPLVLDGIDAEIPKGKIVGLVGPDGAGKTTLIRLIASLLLPSSGSIVIAGKDSLKDPESVHEISGYMPQKFGLYEDLTVEQNLDLYADLRGAAGNERKETIQRLLAFTSLSPFVKRLAGALSGGMKQKLGLACTLIKKPQLLLLDEPSVGVDPLSRRELWKMVSELLKEGISILWSSAYLDEAERCDAVLLLNKGKLAYAGTPSDLTKRVEGRVFKTHTTDGSRRSLLKKVLGSPHVTDGALQGSSLRVVFKPDCPIELEGMELAPAKPRFEDAFIDLLGGGPGGASALADRTNPIETNSHSPVEAKNLVKRFGSFAAVDDISFSVKKGEIFGLLGPNGAGKSTTFKMLCGLLKPTSGSSHVNQYDVQKTPARARSQIGYMAQKFSLYGLLNVRQNLEFFSGIYSLKDREQKEAIEQMVEIFSLGPYLEVTAESLPLGFKQRLSLACATMHRPPVLFLDEPTSGVDPYVRREFWNHINGLVEKGVTVLITTHFMDEAQYCDRIAMIYQGKIIRLDTPDALCLTAKSDANPTPTLEDAFIQMIEEHDRQHQL